MIFITITTPQLIVITDKNYENNLIRKTDIMLANARSKINILKFIFSV